VNGIENDNENENETKLCENKLDRIPCSGQSRLKKLFDEGGRKLLP
jgi:hypothetical protein